MLDLAAADWTDVQAAETAAGVGEYTAAVGTVEVAVAAVSWQGGHLGGVAVQRTVQD